MDTQKFLPFVIVASILLIFFDGYFIVSWTKFIKERKYKLFLYQIMWGLGILCFGMSIVSNIMRFGNYNPHGFEKVLFIMPAIWYLPKTVITPVLIIKDVFNLIKKQIIKRKQKSDIDKTADTGRRNFIQNTGWTAASVPLFLVTDGLLRTTNNFKIHTVDVPLYKLPKSLDGFKIAQISDIHAGSFGSSIPMTTVLLLVESLDPDLIAITGDFVNFHPNELPFIMPQLKNLKAKYGVYGCLGNHDHYMIPKEHETLVETLKEAGIKLLINENETLKIKNEYLQIAGCDNSSYRMTFGNIPKTLDGLKKYLPTILLCHDPSNWDKDIRRKTFADLTLSGHTHGGQVGVELFGDTLTPARLAYKQFAGLYRDRDQYIYVNRGIGTVGVPLRIGINPEITLLTLRSIENVA